MNRLIYSVLFAVLFVCTTTGVSGQAQSGFSFDPSLGGPLHAGRSTNIGSIDIEPDDTMSNMSVGFQFTSDPGQTNAASIMLDCSVSFDVDIMDIWGGLRGHTSFYGPLSSAPVWFGMNVMRNELVMLTNVSIHCPCYPASLNGWGLDNESINMKVIAAGWKGSTFYQDDFNKALIFDHATDTVAFFSMGNTTYDNQSSTVLIDYYLDRNGQYTYEQFAEVISTTSGQAYGTWSTLWLNDGPGTIELNIGMNSWPTFQPSNGIYMVRYGIRSQETCQEISITDTFEISGLVGIMNPFGSKISVFPNPASIGAPVTLNISGSEAVSAIQIWDMNGHKIKDIQPNAVGTGVYQIETANLSPGTHMIRWSDQTGAITTRKLVIQ